ncbi:MAG: hypothetical protein RMY16_23405 [Nostoc sp. DedQUE12b]|uniref:hypothetical protein n=1 Tax=Nostoc sp. DedQUE12b TaxID=3075398 RepID=UPI002AD1E389|nr:hypothetical protein [Nostoc sp. DedQUE12b]MDZ8088482.1 hypothetical protein [Nostoc sp. DedQUE12b]
MDNNQFLNEINSYISKASFRKTNSINCENIFDITDLYIKEKECLDKILNKKFKNTTEQGNLLEELVKLLFKRIDLIHSIEITNRDTTLGQIDIQLLPVDEVIYDVWGMIKEKPKFMIGECKNFSKKQDKVDRPEIEKICWRSCKGGCLSFFIGYGYTQDAIDEIAYFNNNKDSICFKHQGAFIIPLTLSMLETIILNKINFCYFIKWAIFTSRMMSIANYL